MDIIGNIFDFLLNGLGSMVVLPVLMLMMGLIVRMSLRKAFSAALTFGVALAAMSLIIGYMTGAIGPAAEGMTEFVGKEFSIVDGGWVTLASITWSWKYAFLLFPVQLAVNLVMFLTKQTKTINVDLWNVWGKIFQVIVIEAITGSIWLGIAIAAVRMAAELVVGDAIQPRVVEKTGIPGVTSPHSLFLFGAVIYPVEMLLRRVPLLNRASFDAGWLRQKIGLFAENHVMGFVLGIMFGLLARYPITDTIVLGVTCAAAMTLLPMATKLFMQALAPISDACSTFLKSRVKSDREVIIGLDGPILLGNAEIWVAVMLTVPFTLLWSIILPWNSMLPFAGIVNLALALAAFYVCNGNLVRMLIVMIGIGSPVFLLCGTALAPMISDLAIQNGFIEAGTMVSSSALDAPVFSYAFSFIFTGQILPILAGVYWIFGFVLMIWDLRRTYRKPAIETDPAILQEESV
ncbi:MAG: PTS transporter subunit IIC [Propionicimonas sp.]